MKKMVVVKKKLTARQRIAAWYYSRSIINRFKTWWYKKEVMQLITLMDDPKYPNTGISKEPQQLIKDLNSLGWGNKKASRVIRYAVRMGILEDQPMNRGNKKFFYQLNSDWLKW